MDIEQLAGTKLGNYEIESLLGRGGMGVVYKARQISLNRPVALKILPPSLSSDSSFVKRFQREAHAVAQLDHPNIIQIFDISEERGLHFFSMQHVEGRTLDDLLKEKGRLDADEAIEIISQAAHGIQHAHENRILHRDIKPSNIILDKRAKVKMMDFGLARMTGEGSKLTQSGTLMGTLDYMSPEQCRGDELDGRTDIYSLGVVLYEMLTGKAPFDAPNEAALIHKIISEEPAEAKKINPNIPDDLSTIVSRAMAKNRDDRYAGISEFLKELREVAKRTSSLSTEEGKPSPSIAVLPFVDMSPAKDQEYFGDGMAEELINALTQIKDLRVIARTSAFSFKGEKVGVDEIGKKLRVQTVLEGSVRKAGNRLRITAQLVDTTGGHHLWSEKYDRELDDIFAIQDEITLAIVDNLKPMLLGKESARIAERQTVNLEAYNLFLQGRFFWNKQTGETLKKAIEFFELALRKEPNHAQAWAGMADCYIQLPFYSFTAPKEVYPKGREAALKAVEINDSLAEGHTSLAYLKTIYEKDWDGGEKEFERAIELNPGYTTARLLYFWHLTMRTRFDEAIEQIKRALELDPLSIVINRDVGTGYLYTGQYDKAIEAFKKTIDMDPSFSWVSLLLGDAYEGAGMREEAVKELEKWSQVDFGPFVKGWVGLGYARLGRIKEAREAIEILLKESKKGYVSPYILGSIYIILKEYDEGFSWLEKAYEELDPWLCFLKVYRNFDHVRSDPRYLALLKKMNLDK